MKRFICTLLLWSLWDAPVFADQSGTHAAIRAAAISYMEQQTRALPGTVSIRIGTIDPRLTLDACSGLSPYLPAGAKLIGHTSVGVRCETPKRWNVLVPATIRVTVDRLVSNKPLSRGSTLQVSDFTLQRGEMNRPGVLVSPQQVLGKQLRYAIGAGQVLREDMLRAPNVIRQGQMVTLAVQGKGFFISREGDALNDAIPGEAVRIRLAPGQVMTARATPDGAAEMLR